MFNELRMDNLLDKTKIFFLKKDKIRIHDHLAFRTL